MAFIPQLKYKNTSVPAGNTISNDTNELNFASNVIIPANSFSAGDVWRITLFGVYSTFAVAPNITGKLKFNSTVLLNSGALTTVAGVTSAGWKAEAIIVVNSIGSAGSVESQGFCLFSTAATASLNVTLTNNSAVIIDTTIDNTLQVSVQWSSANAANSITLRPMIIEKIN